MSLSGHLLRPVGICPPCFSFIRYIVEKDKYLTPAHSLKSTRSSHSAQYCRYQTYSDALKNSFFPGLFRSGIIFLLRWSISRLLRSLGHSSFSQKHSRKIFLVCFFLFLFFGYYFLRDIFPERSSVRIKPLSCGYRIYPV